MERKHIVCQHMQTMDMWWEEWCMVMQFVSNRPNIFSKTWGETYTFSWNLHLWTLDDCADVHQNKWLCGPTGKAEGNIAAPSILDTIPSMGKTVKPEMAGYEMLLMDTKRFMI